MFLPARIVHASLVVAAISPFSSAGVWVVDAALVAGATHAEIQPAIDAAADGDTILIRTGNYVSSSFSIAGKSLVLAGDGPHPPFLDGSIEIRDLAGSQSVTLRRLQQFVLITQDPGLSIRDCAGSVFVEECSLAGPAGSGLLGAGLYPAVIVENSHNVVFSRSDLFAKDNLSGFGIVFPAIGDGPHGLQSLDSNVALFQCYVRGAAVFAAGKRGGHGAVIAGGSLFASGCSFVGSDGAAANATHPLPGAGGDGIRVTDRIETVPPTITSPALARFVDCLFVSGKGGAGLAGQPSAPDGALEHVEHGATALHLSGPSRLFSSMSPIRAGDATTLTFVAPAGEFAFVAASLAAAPQYANPLQAVLVPSLPFSVLVPIGLMSGTGQLAVMVDLPPLPMGADSLSIVHQAVFASGATLRLGSPSTLLLLDPAY